MGIQIISKKASELTLKEISIMNDSRVEIWGAGAKVDFKKDDAKGEFIFVRNKGKIMAFGMMKPVKIILDKKKYEILGIGRGMAIEKRKGWGKILNDARILRLKESGKTGVAFTGRHNLAFFEKAGYKIRKNQIRKFLYKNPEGKLIEDNDGDLVYYEGKDKFVTKLLKSKNKCITDSDFW
jgi:hypothetical protein